MTTGAKVGVGLGVVAAISIIYFGFTDKGKNQWASLMGPKGTDASGNSIGRPNLADDAGAAVRNGADGLSEVPKKPGFGSPFGSNGADGMRTRRVFPYTSSLSKGGFICLEKSQGVCIKKLWPDGTTTTN